MSDSVAKMIQVNQSLLDHGHRKSPCFSCDIIERCMAEQRKTQLRRKRPVWLIVLGILLVGVVVLFALYQVPAIHDRAYFYLMTLRSRIYYFLRPPAASTFNPSKTY